MSMNYVKHLFALPLHVPDLLRFEVDERFTFGFAFIKRSFDMLKKPVSTSLCRHKICDPYEDRSADKHTIQGLRESREETGPCIYTINDSHDGRSEITFI